MPRPVRPASVLAALLLAACSNAPAGKSAGTCGNGRLDPGEACDDGARNSATAADACRPTCAKAACGDGVVDAGESCDDGVENSNVRPGACREPCLLARCGDGVIDPGEGCDAGVANGEGAACRSDCAPGTCGDGVLNPGEGCDDGPDNGDAPGACRATCVPASCGDGVVDPGERCDEGAENSAVRANACRPTCAPAGCGDGVVDAGEECDDGLDNDDRLPGFCRTGCTLPRCGDGVVDPGEGCDDGPENSDTEPDACRTGCRPAGCGDGILDAGEGCDDGPANSDTAPGACRTTCRPAGCGDGVVEGAEACDDGDANSDVTADACRSDCTLPRCGDGVVDTNERCDDAGRISATEPDACRPGCVLPRCGDGVVDSREECDDPVEDPDDGCDALCRVAIPSTCVASSVPLLDLRQAGVPDGNGYRVDDVLTGSSTITTACGGGGPERLFAFPIPVAGDLLVELTPDPRNPSFQPVVAVRSSCHFSGVHELGCQAAPSGPVRLVLRDVSPAMGAAIVHVDRLNTGSGWYTMRVRVLPPLAAGAPCAGDGSLGRCAEADGLTCADPDGDGLGSCAAAVSRGAACDPAGQASVCEDGFGCLGGACGLSCGDGVAQPWEECDDGNLVDADSCDGDCFSAGRACERVLDLNQLWNPARNGATWSLWAEGARRHLGRPCHRRIDLHASFVAPATGRYDVRLVTAESDPRPALCDRCDAALPPPSCVSALGQGQEFSADLTEGQVRFVRLSDLCDGDPFTLEIERRVCGDGILQQGEECDDGNEVAGDGCAPGCQVEGEDCTAPLPVPWNAAAGEAVWNGDFPAYTNSWRPSCSNAYYPEAVGVFTPPADGTYTFELDAIASVPAVAVLGPSCDPATELACQAPGTGDTPVVTLDLAVGSPVYPVVEGLGAPFTLTIRPVVCGDGRRVLPEECDDGNATAGDGCTDCRADAVAEVEPNGLRGQAQPAPVGTLVKGALAPAGDLDLYAVPLAAGTVYEFETWAGGFGSCVSPPGSSADTVLRLQDATGLELASDDNAGVGRCSRLLFVPPAPGTYYLRVEEFTTSSARPQGIPSYHLRIGTP